MVAEHFGEDLKCGGGEVAVGACSSGRNEDCPGVETVNRYFSRSRYLECIPLIGSSAHTLKCCEVAGLSYGHYTYTRTSSYGDQPS